MAPSVRASTTTAGSSGGSATITVPTNVNGDLLIVIICDQGITPALSGWTATGNGSESAHAIGIWVFTRIAASEPATYTVTGVGACGLVALSVSGAFPSTTPDKLVFQSDGGTAGTALTVPATSGLNSNQDLLIGAYNWGGFSSPAATSLTENGSLSVVQNLLYTPGTNFGNWTGSLALVANSSSSQAATCNQSTFWEAVAIAIAPAVSGVRHPYLPQYKHRQRHQFSIPQHVRIYHPKPAQFETLLVPVRVRPRKQVYRVKWKLPPLRDVKWNPLRRFGRSSFNPALFNVGAPKHYPPRWKPRRIWPRRRYRRFGAVLLASAMRPRYRLNRSMSRWHHAQRLVKRLGSLQQILAARTRAMQHSRSHLPVASRWRQAEVRVKRIRQIISVQVGQLFNNPLIKSLGKMMNRH